MAGMMYEELIKRLRRCTSYDPRFVIQDCEEAADAIEELKKAVLRLEDATSRSAKGWCMMRTDIKKLNNWFSRHGWRRDNRGYEQYIWKEQETCFITHFDGKEYRQINETTILIWPSAKKISVTNRSFWMSSTGDKMECSVGQGFSYALTPEELSKIKELYDALNNELQTARGNKC